MKESTNFYHALQHTGDDRNLGASTGGTEALPDILRELPPLMPPILEDYKAF
jgi:chemotaxis response regulator CheB